MAKKTTRVRRSFTPQFKKDAVRLVRGFESRWGYPPPCLPDIRATVQLPWRDPEYPRSTGLLAVAQLRGCRGVRTWLDTLDG